MSVVLPGIPRAAVYAAFPVLLTQGLRVRRTTERLPEADGVTGASGVDEDAADKHAARVVVLGDSVAAGVGLENHRDALAGRLAVLLARAWDRPVAWTVVARSGLTARGVLDLVGGARLADADVVVVSVGVNDTKNLHGDAQWRAGLGELLDGVLEAAPSARVVLLGIPPMEAFPALPAPLSLLMGARARRMDRIGREVAAARPRVDRLELTGILEPGTAFARDGFHPSAAVHAHLAEGVLGILSA